MSLTVIDIDDCALTVTTDGRVAVNSPTLAVAQGGDLLTGAAALDAARATPFAVHTRFWQALDQVPLATPAGPCRHHADLAYRHLDAVLDAAGRPAAAVFVVPAHYDDAALALLLGIAAATGVTVRGLVDVGVAALAGCAPAGSYLLTELTLHQAVRSSLAVDDGVVRREAVETVDGGGLGALRAACRRVAVAALLEQARYDALHSAAAERRLDDHLPLWLRQAVAGGEVRLELAEGEQRYRARLPASAFARAGAAVLAPLAAVPPAGRALLLGARLAGLPGAADLFTPHAVVPADATWLGVAAAGWPAAAAGAVPFRDRLPACAAPRFAPPSRHARRAASHLLAAGVAHAIGPRPLMLGAAGELLAPGAGARAQVLLHDGAAVLDVLTPGVTLNGRTVTGFAALVAGDVVGCGDAGATFQAIAVLP